MEPHIARQPTRVVHKIARVLEHARPARGNSRCESVCVGDPVQRSVGFPNREKQMKRKFKNGLIATFCHAVLAALIVSPTAGLGQDESIEDSVEILQAKVDRLTSMVQLERGRSIYLRACAPCHGIRGDGKGPAAQDRKSVV